MDRIIYFYVNGMREENTPPFRIYTYRRRGYELLRVGLAGWLVKRWELCGKGLKAGHDTGEKSGAGKKDVHDTAEKGFWEAVVGRLLRQTLLHRTLLRKEKRSAKQELKAEVFFWQNHFEELRTQIGELLKGEQEGVWFSCEEELLPFFFCGEDTNCTDRFCEDTFCVGKIWNRIWPYPFFENYFQTEWVEHMLSYAELPHYIVLGYHRELPRLLCERANRMKSLKWILPERLYDEKLQDFLEDFYEEYGIAAALQLLAEGEDLRRTVLSGRAACNILDFSEEEKNPLPELAEGSIWLDMSSLEGKRRRLEERNTGIRYFSLKKEWKQPVLP